MEVTGRLESWYTQEPPKGSKLTEFIIWGFIYDDAHKRWREGTHMHTSGIPLEELSNLKKGYVVKTRNSSYLLGDKLGKVVSKYKGTYLEKSSTPPHKGPGGVLFGA